MTSMNIYSKEQIDAKAAAILPATTGATAGQVLGLDANLEPAWISGGAPAPILKDLINTTITLSGSKTTFASGVYIGMLDSTTSQTTTYDVGGYRITSRFPHFYKYPTSSSGKNLYQASNQITTITNWLNTNLNQIENGRYRILLSPQLHLGDGYLADWTYTVNNGVFTKQLNTMTNDGFLDHANIVGIIKIN